MKVKEKLKFEGSKQHSSNIQRKATKSKDLPEQSVSGLSSNGSQLSQKKRDDDYSIRQRLNNVKHFTERTRMREINRLYSTLEMANNQISIADDEVEDSSGGKHGSSKFDINDGGGGPDGEWNDEQSVDQGGISRPDKAEEMEAYQDSQNSQEKKNRQSNKWIQQFRNLIVNKLFKINHVLLDNQPLGSSVYQLILLFEFFQMMFYVFHKVPIVNEFAQIDVSQTNSTSAKEDVSGVKQASYNQLDQSNVFRLDLNILFANFQLFPLQSHSTATYLGLYGFFNFLFYVTVIGMLMFAEKAFRALNRDDLKDGSSLAIKALSFVVTLFLSIFFLPMLILNIQGFLCNEDKDDYYVIDEIKCKSVLNEVLTIISTITMVLFIMFCFIQRMLFTSPNLDSFLPWAQLESNVGILKLAWKFYISLAFMLDKFGSLRNELNLVSFAIGAVISYQRLSDSKMHNRRVHQTTTLYEILATWFYLCIPVHNITHHQLTISSILIMFITGLVLAGFFIFLSELRDHEIFLRFTVNNDGDMMKIIKSARQAEILLFNIVKYIGKTQEQLDSMALRGIDFGGNIENDRAKNNKRSLTLNGIISNHLDRCSQRDCTCVQIFGDMFENQAFLSDTWHIMQDEEFKEIQENKKIKSSIKKPKDVPEIENDNSTLIQNNQDQSNNQRTGDNMSQNMDDIPSMLKNLDTAMITPQQQQDDKPPENEYEVQMISIKVYGEDEEEDETSENYKNFERKNAITGDNPPEISNEEKQNFSFAHGGRFVKDSHSSLSQSVKEIHDEVNDLKSKLAQRFKRNVTFGDSLTPGKAASKSSARGTTHNQIVEEFKEDLVATPNRQQVEGPTHQTQFMTQKKLLPDSLIIPNGRERDATKVLHQLSLRYQQRQTKSEFDNDESSPGSPGQIEQESSNSKPMLSVYSYNNGQEQSEYSRNLAKYSHHETFDYFHEEKTMKFLFTALVIERALQKFPRSNELRIHSSLIQSEKLKNEFKAVFELMKCNKDEVSLQCRFQIFRRQILIERKVMQKNQENARLPGRVDPLNSYKYEKLYQRFVRLEYLAANSALSFWKELLQTTNFNTQHLQSKGAQITHCYTQIQEIVKDIERIKPNCISLICRYAIFLKRIVNNENEAVLNYEKAVGFYQRMLSQKGLLANNSDQQSASSINESALFGENSACAVVMVSLQTDRVGTIIHTNDEIYRILGYLRKNMVGQKVNRIQPRPVAVVHDTILKRFLGNYKKSKLVNNSQQLYGISNEGYLRPLSLLVKLYPQISGQITMVGYLQLLPRIDGLDLYSGDAESVNYQNLPHHFIITDINNSIDCVSRGLFEETGLCSKFFGTHEQMQHNSVHIEKLFGPEITATELQEQLCTSGLEFQLNTSNLLQYVNSEQLTEEELEAVKQRLGVYRVNVMMRRSVFLGELFLYRIIILPATKESSNRLQKFVTSMQNNNQISKDNNLIEDNHLELRGSNASDDYYTNDLPSQYSGTSSNSVSSGISNTYYKMISDFKNSLGSRQTPKYILWLSRLLTLVLIITITISSIEYRMKSSFVKEAEMEIGEYMIKSEARLILLIQLALDVRSIVNVANDIEFTEYQGTHLGRIDRFKYLNSVIQKETEQLQEIQDYLMTKRGQQQTIEDQNVELYRYSTLDTIVTDRIPFKMGLQNYLNNILLLNSSTPEQLRMSLSLIPGSPYLPKNSTTFYKTSLQRELYFNLANQFRDFIASAQYANDQLFQRLKEESKNIYRQEFMITMILGILVSLTSFLLILRQIVETERTKREIMSIFGILSTQDIKQVYDVCDQYLEHNFVGTGKLQEANQEQINKWLLKTTSSSRRSLAQVKKPWEENPKEYYGRMLRDTQSLIKEQSVEKVQEVQAQKEKMRSSIGKSSKSLRQPQDPEATKRKKTVKLQDQKVTTSNRSQPKAESTKLKLLKRFHVGIGYGKKKHGEEINSQRHLQSDFDSARGDEDKSQSGSESEEEKERENEKIKRKNKREAKKLQEIEEAKQIQDRNQQKISRGGGSSSKCLRILSLNLITCLLFCGYFIFGFVFHIQQLKVLEEIVNYSPLFCKRYSSLYLSYGFLREKIISQNNPKIFTDFHVPNHDPLKVDDFIQDIEKYYHELSMQTEKEISRLKVLQLKSIAPAIEFFSSTTDSENFCSHIVGLVQGSAEEKIVLTKNVQQKLDNIRKVAYQKFIDTVIAACTAASEGKLEQLKKIKAETNLNLNDGDYDKRTPLHVSCGAGHENVVRYLVDVARVNLSPVDRWGATPLNDCYAWPNLREFMKSRGAVLGKPQPAYSAVQVTVTEDQFRLYYAAFFGDVSMMENLRLLGWNVNGQDYDGRTALGVASSEGHLNVVKYLISKGADVNIKDARGNDALADAKRENRTEVIDYLLNEALILVYCLNFESQLFSKGVQQVIGVFNQQEYSVVRLIRISSISISQLVYRRVNTPYNGSFYVYCYKSLILLSPRVTTLQLR